MTDIEHRTHEMEIFLGEQELDAPGGHPAAARFGPASGQPGGGGPPGAKGRRAPWVRILGIGVAAFLLWLVLDAPTLQHNAQGSPVGTRRTVALDILGPIAALSRGLQLSHLVSSTNQLLGKDGPGTLGASAPPVTFPARVPSTHGRPAPAPGPPPTAPPVAQPTSADPLRVLVVGDSLGLDLGDSLTNDLSNTGVVSATLDGVESTGLTRPDYFNWPAELQADLTRLHPQVVVIMLGANDPQDIPGPNGDLTYGTTQWDAAYTQRVSSFMALAESQGARVIWVGMPPMQDGGLSAEMQHLDGIYQSQAAAHHVTYVSSWNLLGGPQGQYEAYLSGPNGQEVNVRDPDGTHIAPGGGEILSQAVMSAMRQQLGIKLPTP